MTQQTTLILGAPGCGKTTRLLQIVEAELASGTQSERVAFVSFTKQAATVALTRARDKFGIPTARLPLFRTLHSLAFRALHIRHNQLMQPKHYTELCGMLGIDYGDETSMEDGAPSEDAKTGNRLVFMDNLARTRLTTHAELWREFDTVCELPQLEQFSRALRAYKHDHGVLDFTDLLERYAESGAPYAVDVAVIDEAQDLSRLQWQVVSRAFGEATRAYIAGDDDQAIYEWSGADVKTFLGLQTDKREVLDTSHRLTYEVKAVADRIIGRVTKRYSKVFNCRPENGAVEWLAEIDVDLVGTSDSWLLLARNTRYLRNYFAMCRAQGVPYYYRGQPSVDPAHVDAIKAWTRLTRGGALYGDEVRAVYECIRPGAGITRGARYTTELQQSQRYEIEQLKTTYGLQRSDVWHEAFTALTMDTREYYLNVLRSGYKLDATPRVTIGTIHSVKGEEADNVVLLTDISQRTADSYLIDSDTENRVFYVGVTRARNKLYIVQPQTLNYFQM